MQDNLIHIGKITKCNEFNNCVEILVLDDFLMDVEPDFLFVEVDNYFVPLKIQEAKKKSARVVCVEPQSPMTDVKRGLLTGCHVYVDKEHLENVGSDELENYQTLFIGCQLYDRDGKPIGNIVNIDTSTINFLLELDNGILLPFHEDIILDMDLKNQKIRLDVGDEIINLNK
ncbi:MAG: hypothetical protein IJ553_03700 [Alloprevotella sp.]|nr:hypothetical protein [Alloprevotella sp.]